MTAVPISSPSLPYLPCPQEGRYPFTAGSTGEFSSRENSHHYLRRIRTHDLPLSSLPCSTARPLSPTRGVDYFTLKGELSTTRFIQPYFTRSRMVEESLASLFMVWIVRIFLFLFSPTALSRPCRRLCQLGHREFPF